MLLIEMERFLSLSIREVEYWWPLPFVVSTKRFTKNTKQTHFLLFLAFFSFFADDLTSAFDFWTDLAFFADDVDDAEVDDESTGVAPGG